MLRENVAARIVADLRDTARLRSSIADDPALAARVAAVKAWQAERLEHTYADLLASPRYGDAARFILTDLYGARDFSRRDADLERIVPALQRMLPSHALGTVASAIELEALTERLDAVVGARLEGTTAGPLDPDRGLESDAVRRYAQAYRTGDARERDDRDRQVALVERTGAELDRVVRIPFVHGALKLMRGPARAAGLESLQGFLERGYEAFSRMRGASDFIATVAIRERQIAQRLVRGDALPFARSDP